MTKSRLSLKNLTRAVPPFSLYIVSCLCLISGCSASTQPTYSKENIIDSIENICKKEYNLEVKAKLVGRTVWVYLPLEDIIERAKKPEKYLKRFVVEQNKDEFRDEALKLQYLIKPIPEEEKYQEIKYNKSALENIHNVWKALRRVVFSMEHSRNDNPQFFCLVTADIKNGFQIQEIFYHPDLKKVSYELISLSEYQHRTIQDMQISPQIIGDKEGLYLNYRDITWREFILSQIQYRIKLKFEKPEVDKDADIDKEILKIVAHTLKTYGFKDFSEVELSNLLTQRKINLNQAAIWAGPLEQRF